MAERLDLDGCWMTVSVGLCSGRLTALLVACVLWDFSTWVLGRWVDRAEMVWLPSWCVTSIGGRLVGLGRQMVWVLLWGIWVIWIMLRLCVVVWLLWVLVGMFLVSLLWGIVANPARGGRGV